MAFPMYVLSLPAIYALELTPACDNRCPGCSNIYSSRRAPAATDADTWAKWLAVIGPAAVQIRLTGGEPTLHPGFLRILAEATAYDAWVTVFTNGRWREPERLVAALAQSRQLSGLLVSLHGADARQHEAFSGVPGSFAETLANIRLALAAGVRVALSTVITQHNWHDLSAMADLGRQLGVQHVAFNRYLGEPAPGLEPADEQQRAACREIERLIAAGADVKYGIGLPQCFMPNDSEGCLAGVAYAAVDPWGRLHPCVHSPSIVGSLREQTLSELWHSPAMSDWRNLMPGECRGCAAYSMCHGGCRAVQELRPDRRDPLRKDALTAFTQHGRLRELPATGRPVLRGAVRAEPFGYVVLGYGQLMPVRAEAHPLLTACDGALTFTSLAERFGQAGLELLGDLWEIGLLQIE
jgi:radical SAM protein with 4Fe4S-binding SPASM domain